MSRFDDTVASEAPARSSGAPAVAARVLARNTLLNITGQVVPVLVNIVALPYVIRHLGADQFGLLSLAWLVVGYFTLFDLGIGPATTKFVADLLGRGESERMHSVVWTAVISQTFLGLLGAVILALATPLLVTRVLTLPAGLHHEGFWVFLTVAVSLPISFATGSLGGVLAASQRFDLLNAINIPSSCLTYLLPAFALAAGYGLRLCVVLVVLARALTLLVNFVLCLKLHPQLRHRPSFDWVTARSLLRFGGWVAVSGAVGGVLMYCDRFLFGILISVAAIGFFTPPNMLASKLGMVPSALLLTLFPAFVVSHGRGDREWMRRTFARSTKAMLLTVGPAAILLVFLARDILTAWLGSGFASEGTLVLQILAIGRLFNAVSHVPLSMLQGIGRPDLTAKLQIVQVPLHLILVWTLTRAFGLAGGAFAWTLRMALECALFMAVTWSIDRRSCAGVFGRDVGNAMLSLGLLAGTLGIIGRHTNGVLVHCIAAGLVMVVFLLGLWRFALVEEERDQIRTWLKVRSRA